MTKIFKVIAKDGYLIKGESHNAESFKKLNLSDIVFDEDKLYSVAGFDDNGNPLLSAAETVFESINYLILNQ